MSTPSTNSEITDDTDIENGYHFRAETEFLSAWAYWLEVVVQCAGELPTMETLGHSTLKIVDIEKLAEKYNLTDEAERIKTLVSRIDDDYVPQARFEIARRVSRRIVNQYSHELPEEGGVRRNFEVARGHFEEAQRMESSGFDILASRLLLPDPVFTEMCMRYKHMQEYLATIFEVPLGAVAIRQKIAHYPRAFFNVPERIEDKDLGRLELQP